MTQNEKDKMNSKREHNTCSLLSNSSIASATLCIVEPDQRLQRHISIYPVFLCDCICFRPVYRMNLMTAHMKSRMFMPGASQGLPGP